MNIALLRLSAIGDVALWVPVVKRVLQLNAEVSITVITKPKTAFLFEGIEKCKVYTIETEKNHKGILGLLRFAKEINSKNNFDAVIDGHDVLRTKVIRNLLATDKQIVFEKASKEKRNIIQKKQNESVSSTITRYCNAFASLGLRIDEQFSLPVFDKLSLVTEPTSFSTTIGIAPFATHAQKVYPLALMEQVVKILSEKNISIILFGFGEYEENILKSWSESYSNVFTSFQYSFAEQLIVFTTLSCMLCMDSSNMHLAALQGIPTISIWGATSTSLGFQPYGKGNIFIENDSLPCRPCSVYGNKPCQFAADSKEYLQCFTSIAPEKIVETILKVIQ
jgi:ADP-heptose:LPS heptosyltransferase